MAKIFDCEDEPNEFMEMPCRCDCGKWFDLHDGFSSEKNPRITFCRECMEKEEKELELEDEIKDLQRELADAEYTVRENRKRLAELGQSVKAFEPLKFANPTAANLTYAFGIPMERAEFLGKELDKITAEFSGGGLRMVYMSELIARLEEICFTDEERVWCIVNHIQWLAINKRLVPPATQKQP